MLEIVGREKNSGITDIVGTSLSKANLGIWLPALIGAILKTAQGSSTVAIITTASLLSPLLNHPNTCRGGDFERSLVKRPLFSQAGLSSL